MLIHYLTVALRNITRRPLFFFINIGGLGISLASCIFILYYVYDEVTYDRFHQHANRIYRLTQVFITPENSQNIRWTHQKLGPYMQRVYPQVEACVRFEDAPVKLGKSKISEKGIVRTDASVFEVFTYPLIAGNSSTALERPQSIVLSQSLAHKYFSGEALGQTLDVDGVPHVVTGVMKDLPRNSDKWVTALISSDLGGEEGEQLYFTVDTYVLLRSQADADFIKSELPNIAASFSPAFDHGLQLALDMQALTDLHFLHGVEMDNPKGNKSQVMIFSVVALVLLAVAIFNFVNLTTVRSIERAREVGVRKVTGAQHGQLVRQFLGESLLSIVLSCLVALFVMQALRVIFESITGKVIAMTNAHDSIVIGGALGLLVIITAISAFYPAWVLSLHKPARVLKGNLGSDSRVSRSNKIFIATQFAISAALLVFLVILLAQTTYMQTTELGFQKDQILVVPVPEDSVVRTHVEMYRTEFVNSNLVEGFSIGGFASNLGTTDPFASPLWLEGDQERQLIAPNITVDRHYPRLLQLKIKSGRSFDDFKDSSVKGKALVNEAFAKLSGWTDPIGHQVRTYSGKAEIIGVINDFHFQSLHNVIEPLVIMGMDDGNPDARFFFMKANPANVEQIRALWSSLIPQHSFDYFFLDQFFDEQYRVEKTMEVLFLYFTLVTIIISASGLFAVTYHHIQLRMREIGIRKVFGAGKAALMRLLSAQFVRMVSLGALVGMAVGFFAADRWLLNFAYRTEVTLVMVMVPGLTLILLSLVVIATKTYAGASRNPAEVMRHE